MEYKFKEIEQSGSSPKDKDVYEVKVDPFKKEILCFDMFPYPSGVGFMWTSSWLYSSGYL